MRHSIAALGALVLFLAAPGVAAAQDLATVCRQLQTVEAGGWAEYQVSTPQGDGTIRLALLDEGAADDPGLWLEMSGQFSGQNSILQLLIEEYPYEADDISAVVMKMGDQPAQRLPDSMLGQMRGQINSPVGNIAEECGRSELVGTESIEVPAGTFDALHLRPPAGDEAEPPPDVWVSEDVPFGLLKAEGSQGTMVLAGAGDDATSRITETPADMGGMGGMGGP